MRSVFHHLILSLVIGFCIFYSMPQAIIPAEIKKAGALRSGFILEIPQFYDGNYLTQMAANGCPVVWSDAFCYAVIHIQHAIRKEIICNCAISIINARSAAD